MLTGDENISYQKRCYEHDKEKVELKKEKKREPAKGKGMARRKED